MKLTIFAFLIFFAFSGSSKGQIYIEKVNDSIPRRTYVKDDMSGPFSPIYRMEIGICIKSNISVKIISQENNLPVLNYKQDSILPGIYRVSLGYKEELNNEFYIFSIKLYSIRRYNNDKNTPYFSVKDKFIYFSGK